MNIVCVDYPFTALLENLGHQVLSLRLEPGLTRLADLPELSRKDAFQADLFIQQERLGPRVILEGVHKLPCTAIFISVDTHLNMFWHRYYARLFDLTLTAHVSWFERQSDDFGQSGCSARNVHRLRHCGDARLWRDFSRRRHDFSFCGVVDKHRPVRNAMLELLGRHFALHRPEKSMPRPEMLDMFSDTRIVPNESIAEEVNFRLFEGASCGCLVLGQEVGEDQNACFEPGREVILYAHGLDLLEKAVFYRKNERTAEEIARAAWLRVQAEHLPQHRVKELLATAEKWARGAIAGGRAEKGEADKYFCLTLQQLAFHGSLKQTAKQLLDRFMALPEDGEVAAAALQTLMQLDGASRKNGLAFCAEIFKEALYIRSTACNLACSVFCRLQGDTGLSNLFLERQIQAVRDGRNPDWEPENAHIDPGSALYDFYILWARLLYRQKKLARPGCRFAPEAGVLPENALECLLLAQAELEHGARVSMDNKELMEEMHRIFSVLPGYADLDRGALAHLSLYAQNSWPIQMDFALSGLKCHKIETGLAELAEALDKAEKQGEAEDFFRRLAGIAASESILRVLKQ
ncbi:MAG: glycosyltransferase [Deltaproteobacteria bacterium]|jgi:hypothetical protein|nr:glycosyltransferase [Deltaproteobacteria bacterium]